MKRSFFIFMGFLLPILSLAQVNQSVDNNLIIKVSERETGQFLPFATVVITDLKKDSSTVIAGITDTKGSVAFSIPAGTYLAKVSLVGYRASQSAAFEISQQGSVQITTQVELHKAANTLQEVSIVGAKKTIEPIPGGYKFNVENIIGATGSIFEVLKQVPGVTVDGTNSIKLQGKGPTVLVNGRKVNMSGDDLAAYLKSISATQVSDIDIHTNPDAKFDADGEGGILNIKLKQRTTPGLFGNVSTNISTLISTDNSASVNLKKDRWDLSASYNYTYRQDYYRRNIYYENRNLPDSLYIFRQNQNADRTQKSNYFKGGAAYQLDSTSTLSVNFFGAWFNLSSPTNLVSEIFNRANIFQNRYLQNTKDLTDNDFSIYDLLYKKTFKNKNQLGAGLNYSKYGNRADQNFTRTFFDMTGAPVTNQYADNRLISTVRPYNLLTGNIDYTAELGRPAKLEIGAKYSHTRTGSYFINDVYDNMTNTYVNDPSLSNDLDYTESITAAYAMFSGKLDKLSYQLGIRYEGFNYELTSPSLPAASNNYNNFFPNLNISYSSNDRKSTYSVNFGRRIQRPGYASLNPFVNVTSLGQYHTGNPYLRPYFVNRVEIQYSKSYGNSNFLMLSLFASNSRDMFSALFKYDIVRGMNYDTYDNFRNNTQYGGYAVLQNTITKWFNFNAYLAGTQSAFSSKIPDDVLFPGNFSLTGNVSLNFALIKNTPFQIYGYLVTKSNYFQLQNATNGNISIAVQHKFLSNKLTASINIEDIFNINRYAVTVNTANVYLHSLNKIQSQHIKLGLNYSIGQSFKSKSNRDLKKDSRID